VRDASSTVRHEIACLMEDLACDVEQDPGGAEDIYGSLMFFRGRVADREWVDAFRAAADRLKPKPLLRIGKLKVWAGR
jgi:hypothetical protein